ncbi:MAG: transposase, partial [Bacteroidota bacterium]|nr:transposase [Bacteroidota bacterium]
MIFLLVVYLSYIERGGQNLSLHPHIHCIVPAAGLTVRGQAKSIGKEGKYLYPVRQLSVAFR